MKLTVKVLYILTDGLNPLPTWLIEMQSEDNDVEIIDLSEGNVSYEDLVEKLFDADKVISW
ncbi:MAG: hypothetical protein V3R51_05095 [Gammaproteobacteria bacterium]